MSSLWRPLESLIRKLSRAPLFTILSIVTLALGIGATSAIFSVVHGVLLKPLPFEEPEELVGLWHSAPGLGFETLNQAPAFHFTYRDEKRAFEDIGMWAHNQVTITDVAEPERVQAMRVTDGTFSLLRVRPAVGRIFSAEDDTPGSAETAIISHAYWQRRFGGDAGVVGRTLDINGRPTVIVGVLPPDFRFLRFDPAVFLPFRFDRLELFIGNFSYQGIARLKKGSTIADANADVARMIPLATERFPFPSGFTPEMLKEARFGPNVRPLKEDVVGDVGRTLWILLGTVGLVLLIACANVANLFFVRAESRQRELALRTALGANRARVAKELLGESVSLGLLGGLAGLGIAYAAIRLLIALAPQTFPASRRSELISPYSRSRWWYRWSPASSSDWFLSQVHAAERRGSPEGRWAHRERGTRPSAGARRSGGDPGGAGARAPGGRWPHDPKLSGASQGRPGFCPALRGAHLPRFDPGIAGRGPQVGGSDA